MPRDTIRFHRSIRRRRNMMNTLYHGVLLFGSCSAQLHRCRSRRSPSMTHCVNRHSHRRRDATTTSIRATRPRLLTCLSAREWRPRSCSGASAGSMNADRASRASDRNPEVARFLLPAAEEPTRFRSHTFSVAADMCAFPGIPSRMERRSERGAPQGPVPLIAEGTRESDGWHATGGGPNRVRPSRPRATRWG